jgi:hypothetical protein
MYDRSSNHGTSDSMEVELLLDAADMRCESYAVSSQYRPSQQLGLCSSELS